MKPPRPYVGILKEPISQERYFRRGTFLDGSNHQADLAQKFAELILQKMDALYRHYDIDKSEPSAGDALALQLARAHVPGFQIKSDADTIPGQKRSKWNTDRIMCLYATVRALKQRDMSERSALQHIANNDRFSDLHGGVTYNTLRNVYEKYCRQPRHNPLIQFEQWLLQLGSDHSQNALEVLFGIMTHHAAKREKD